MVDGKVINTETASGQRCYICHATPAEMNVIETVSSRGRIDRFRDFHSVHALLSYELQGAPNYGRTR